MRKISMKSTLFRFLQLGMKIVSSGLDIFLPIFFIFLFTRLQVKGIVLVQRWEKVGKYQGTYNRNLDAKKRLQVPSKLVGGTIPAKFYMLRGFDGCIAVYDETGYNALMETLEPKLYQGPSQYKYIRKVMESVNELDVDSHGRITLGEAIAKQYKIGDTVLILGMINHFEIWNPELYDEYMNGDETFEELAERSAKSNG